MSTVGAPSECADPSSAVTVMSWPAVSVPVVSVVPVPVPVLSVPVVSVPVVEPVWVATPVSVPVVSVPVVWSVPSPVCEPMLPSSCVEPPIEAPVYGSISCPPASYSCTPSAWPS
jgi:hypothetical protein